MRVVDRQDGALGRSTLGSARRIRPGARFSFGYTKNAMSAHTTIDDRCQSLVDATYRALGWSADDYGTWIKG